MKSHLQSYPCPLQINSFWNLGFLLGITIILQIITGIFLGLHYTSDLNSAYSSLFFFIREIYYGWCLRYFHSNGASFVFLFIFLHIGRAIFYSSYFYNPNTWFSGIIILFFLMATAFMGYVLPFGQMSFWGATVITNLLSPFPSLIEWVCGGHYVYNPTLKRFFLFHFIFPFLISHILILGRVLLIIFFLVFLLFLVSEGLLFVSFFWTSFHSLSSPSLGIWPGEGFYVPDPCELTFANTLLLSNAAISLGNAFISLEISSQFLIFFSLFSFILAWTFISLQIKEFRIMGLSINDSVYSCLFFFLTGLHFLHLLFGLLLLCLLFWSCSFSFRA